MNEKINKVVITSVPYTDTNSPIMAPAILKSIATQAGIDSVAFDLNALVHKKLLTHSNRLDLIDFFFFEKVVPDTIDEIHNLFKFMADEVMQHKPDMVCLSLLHYQCQTACKWLCFYIKKYYPGTLITIGGTGVASQLVQDSDEYGPELLKKGLIDYYISGDGEESFNALLTGNPKYPGINSPHWKTIEDLNSIPFPNYDDYNLNLYSNPFIGILGSRGCVRQCTFCDIHEYWEKFNWRTADSIFSEMLYQNQKHGTRTFKFQDSLVNGNVKEYNKLIRLLAEHNKNNPEQSFRWSGYFIFRPAAQMSEEMWRLTAESGAYVLSVGIESLVEKNRYHLKKKFSNEDVEYGLVMAKRYGVKLFFITLVGYVTETEQDHLETLEWIRSHKQYAGDPILQFSVGGTVAILPNTWLDRNQKQLGIIWINKDEKALSGKNHLWKIESTGNTYETRLRRMDEIIRVGLENGFKIHKAVIDPQKELENMIQSQTNPNEYSSNYV